MREQDIGLKVELLQKVVALQNVAQIKHLLAQLNLVEPPIQHNHSGLDPDIQRVFMIDALLAEQDRLSGNVYSHEEVLEWIKKKTSEPD